MRFWAIVVGGKTCGLTLYGPYSSSAQAADAAARYLDADRGAAILPLDTPSLQLDEERRGAAILPLDTPSLQLDEERKHP